MPISCPSVCQANPLSYDRVEDLSSLLYLNESSILHSLRQRYGGNLIHTYAGSNLMVINPLSTPAMYSEKVRTLHDGPTRVVKELKWSVVCLR